MNTHDFMTSQFSMNKQAANVHQTKTINIDNINEKNIQKYLNENGINLKINKIDDETLYIRNFSDNVYYEIYISTKYCQQDIYQLNIFRCIVRNDDWIVTNQETSMFCNKNVLIQKINSTNIKIDDNLYNLLFIFLYR